MADFQPPRTSLSLSLCQHTTPDRIHITNLPNPQNTFRDRLRKPYSPSPSPGHNPNLNPTPRLNHSHSKARSDSILLDVKRPNANANANASPSPSPKTTMVHHGTSFEILNPHDSLNYARIVSYIEDVDYSSVSSEERLRESFLDGGSGSCASTTVGTILSETAVTTGVGLESSTSRSASASPAQGEGEGEDEEEEEEEVPQRRHSDLVGDAAHVPLPSISERLATSPSSVEGGGGSPVSPVSGAQAQAEAQAQAQGQYRERSDTLVSGPSDIGEPGPMVEDGCLSLSSSSSSSSSSSGKPRQVRDYNSAYSYCRTSDSPARKPERDCSTACSYYFSPAPGNNRSVQPPTPRPGSEMGVRARPESRLRQRAVTRLRGVLGGLPFFRRSR